MFWRVTGFFFIRRGTLTLASSVNRNNSFFQPAENYGTPYKIKGSCGFCI